MTFADCSEEFDQEVIFLKASVFNTIRNWSETKLLSFKEIETTYDGIKNYLIQKRAQRKAKSAVVGDDVIELVTVLFLKELRGIRFNLSSTHRKYLPNVSYETFRNQLRILRDWKENGFKDLKQ